MVEAGIDQLSLAYSVEILKRVFLRGFSKMVSGRKMVV